MGTQPQPKIRFPQWPLRRRSARVLLLSAAVALTLLTGGVLVSQRVILAGDSSAKYPAAKATYMARYQQAQATARAKYPPATKGLFTPSSSPQPTPTFVAGIVDTHEGPFPACDLTVRNAWQGQVNGVWELVYAGVAYPNFAEGDCSSGLGGLRIYNSVTYANLGTFLAPAGTSALTITAVNGVVMQLRSDSGQLLTFNLQTHQYGQG